MINYAFQNKFIASLGLKVPNLNSSKQVEEYRKSLPDEIMDEITLASKRGILIEPTEYFSNPKFDCFVGKKRSLSIGPDLEIQYCYKTSRKTGMRITDFTQESYQKYFQGLKEHIDECNPMCASNCAYMGYYFIHHPIKVLKLFFKYTKAI